MNRYKDYFTKEGISLSEAIRRQEEYESSLDDYWHYCKCLDGSIGIVHPNAAIDVPFEVVK